MTMASKCRFLLAACASAVVLFLARPILADKRWDRVDPQDLALQHPSVEPDADAEALLWTVTVEDEVENGVLLPGSFVDLSAQVGDNHDRVIADGDELYLLAPLAGG